MSTLPYNRITKIKFGVSGDADILKESSVSINNVELFKNGRPYPNGPNDEHLGSNDHYFNCQTCYNNKKNCLGHDGHLVLNYPVRSPMFVQECNKWLRLCCFKCGTPIINHKVVAKYPVANRLDEAAKLAKSGTKRCPSCDTVHPNIVKDKDRPLLIKIDDKSSPDNKKLKIFSKLYPHMIKEILNKISDETVLNFGKSLDSHPAKFILNVIKIPPTTIRPDTKKINGGRSTNNDLTTLLQNLVRDNEKISPTLPDEISPVLENYILNLNELYYTFVKGSAGAGKAIGSREPPVSIGQRIKGKKGRLRKNALGKRVRLVARSTITGVSTLKIDQLGVPLRFAKILQIEETVQEYNKKKLTINFLNGRARYPGCTKIIKKSTNTEYSVDNINMDTELEVGDIIYRDLEDGDYILYNRQPSLLPSSISAHEIVITMDPAIITFQMNVIVCKLYGADFDGDQMNAYVVSNVAARNEIQQLSGVPNWFIKHANCAPMLGQIDDSIIGMFCLTREGVKIDKYHAMLMFAHSTFLPTFTDYDPKTQYSGRDMVTKVLSETPINYNKVPGYYNEKYTGIVKYNPADIKVRIENGIHYSGVLDKSSISSGAINGLYHNIYSEYGPQRTLEIIFNMQQVAINYMYYNGFTIGIMDIVVSKKALNEIHEIEASILNKSELITDQLNNGEIIPPVGKTTEEYYEELQIANLKIIDDFADPIFQSVDVNTNNLIQLIVSGSKGSINHMFHISSAIGQIEINGERPAQKFAYARTLPQFPRFDTDPSARGFIKNSYLSGMNAAEETFNSQNARYDFISIALLTAVTGESERKSIKSLESIVVDNLHRCVKGSNVIQLCYGEDGLNPQKLIRVRIPTIMVKNTDLRKGWFYTSEIPLDSSQVKVFEDEYARVVADRDEYRKIFLLIEKNSFNENITADRMFTIDINKLVANAITRFGEQKPTIQEIIAQVKQVEDLCTSIEYALLNEIQEKRKTKVPEFLKSATWMIKVLIRAELNSMRSLRKLNPEITGYIINMIKIKQTSALVDYGTAAGLMAAMSFSEPLTQYMLDSKHRTTSGGTKKSVLTNVREILGAKPTAKLAAPSMILAVLPEFETEAKIQEIANSIEAMTLLQFVSTAQIFFEKFGEPVHSQYKHEKKIIADWVKYNPLLTVPGDLNRWCIRFVLNKTKMIYKNMNLELIVITLRDKFPDLFIINSPENSNLVMIRVYCRSSYFRDQPNQGHIEKLRDVLLNMIIRGIKEIKIASVIKVGRNFINSEGEIQRKDKLVIKTLGTNLAAVMKVPVVDIYDIQTDAIEETQELFGIEAARALLIPSIKNLGAGGIDYHHISTYADEMCFTGKVTSIEKQGLKVRERSNILLRMGFSSPIQALEEAATNSIESSIGGITSPLLIGAIPEEFGTARNKFHINEHMVKSNTVNPDLWLDNL